MLNEHLIKLSVEIGNNTSTSSGQDLITKKGVNLSKTRIVSFFFFLAVQLVLTANISKVAFSEDDPAASSFVETGEASWYGPGFHGEKPPVVNDSTPMILPLLTKPYHLVPFLR